MLANVVQALQPIDGPELITATKLLGGDHLSTVKVNEGLVEIVNLAEAIRELDR